MSAPADRRTVQLNKVLQAFIRGRRPLSTIHDARLFFEAVCAQPSASVCLETILAQSQGIEVIQKSVRASTSTEFLTNQVLPFLAYMAHPDIKSLYEGTLLEKVILTIVDPPMMWKAMVQLWIDTGFLDKETNADTFAWLCLEVVSQVGSELAAAVDDVKEALEKRPLVQHPSMQTRSLGYRVQKALQLKFSDKTVEADLTAESPGGRHDNDFADFREIEIYPTTDEFVSTQRPFYRVAAEIAHIESSARVGGHLDNQFRLLREDMLGELREDIHVATGKTKKGRRKAQIFDGLVLQSINTGDAVRAHMSSLAMSITGKGVAALQNLPTEKRREYLFKNRNFLRHNSFGALCADNAIVGFAFTVRNIDKLIEDPPKLELQFSSSRSLMRALAAFQAGLELRFVLVDTPVFAYEPVLRQLKKIAHLPLERELLRLEPSGDEEEVFSPPPYLHRFLVDCRAHAETGMAIRVEGKKYELDAAQLHALAYALEKPLSVIQGPPGTGKSYIGALASTKLLEDPSTRLLVLAYTNHALDQFLEDLLHTGIDPSTMTRLGSKSSDETAKLLFSSSFRTSDHRRSREANSRLHTLQGDIQRLRPALVKTFEETQKPPPPQDVLDALEFADDAKSQSFWAAFQIKDDEGDGFVVATKDGQPLSAVYVMNAWLKTERPGFLVDHMTSGSQWIWAIPMERRKQQWNEWTAALRAERLEELRAQIDQFDETQTQVDMLFNEAKCSLIQTKRVIGCTTTGAAMFAALLNAAKPTHVIVEEAGEVLEAHVLTALAPSLQQLILIGDHKQLRPKCNNYGLSVEKGSGYDLNRSLFERLILQGHPHATLCTQHRMAPEISRLVRSMMYPDLQDGTRTRGRPEIRGLHSRVSFVNHDHPEDVDARLKDRNDGGQPTSRQNPYEAQMVLKLVKYLGQQGYKTDDMVVLTPYLGQLRLLQTILAEENDPMLSDLDSYELIRAGLMTDAASRVNKKPIRISTIDNYQGEEADIVIACLTRSNAEGQIGFMKSPERLNVLVSRARNCLVLFGNMDTFMKSPQGADTWVPFFQLLQEGGHLKDGLEVRCEQHPDHTALLVEPRDFDLRCPDGGCSEPCGAQLPCGLHTCQRRCHRLPDHSKTVCKQKIGKTCDKGHSFTVSCDNAKARCQQCEREEADMRRRLQRDLDIEKARLAREKAFLAELQSIQDEIVHQRRLQKVDQEKKQQADELAKNRAELASLQSAQARKDAEKAKAEREDEEKSKPAKPAEPAEPAEPGSAQEQWEYMKREELAQSDAIDALMTLIGLEDVKREFLNIKETVETAVLQGISAASERFGCSMLGNPGTGKTTVARLYAQLLTSMGVVAGNCFEETTGSKMASMGVAGCQNLIDGVLANKGGVIFIDEAYQLSSGNNPGGAAVLDFLLAEVENLTGKICFVLAGYAKQMESFFAHNPGFPSRFPHEMKFQDYTDVELLKILEMQANKKYKDTTMKVEDGLRGLYCRIATRRVGRGRGREGFGNARAIENLLARIARRQSERLGRERRAHGKPDVLLMTKQDLIGPQPAGALQQSEAWAKLQGLEGLRSVKESVKALVDSIEANYQRELREEPLLEYSLNRVFLGNPGTGKTTVATLYGQILVDLGLLSNGEVVVKNPADFVGAFIGHSEKQTKGILAATAGKVLVIDEAYALYDGGGVARSGTSAGMFKTAVIDTLVAEIQSTPGDDRCVLLLGYQEQMEEMFQNVNPGLSRRFPLSSAFVFEDFDQAELGRILDMKLRKQGFTVTGQGRQVALDMLDRARNRPNFGNAGEIDILLNEAKMRHQKHLSADKTRAQTQRSTLDALDFDEDYARLARAETDIAALFHGTVGCEEIMDTLRGYQETTRSMKALSLDPKESIDFNFIFRGPPGTGKTTTARRMGKVFYDMGFLANASVLDVSASDLIGQFIGHTGPKVRQLLDKALGRVLLIDEAYRLAEGQFAKEALDELVDAVTKEKYHKRLIIILAGYEADINRLLRVNSGLGSRFSKVLDFAALPPDDCLTLLATRLAKQKHNIEDVRHSGSVDMRCLADPTPDFRQAVLALFGHLAALSSWASARDVETLAKSVFQAAVKTAAGLSSTAIVISADTVQGEMEAMLRERRSREKTPKARRPLFQDLPMPPAQSQESQQAPPPVASSTNADAAPPPPPEEPAEKPPEEKASEEAPKTATRDAGVSDEVWNQLQKDAAAQQKREEKYQANLKAKEALDKALDKARKDALEQRILGELLEEDKKKREEEERQRKKKEEEDDAMRRRIVQELLEQEKRRKRKAAIQAKLTKMGRCPMNFEWVQQAGGWRCRGGSHFVTNQQLL